MSDALVGDEDVDRMTQTVPLYYMKSSTLCNFRVNSIVSSAIHERRVEFVHLRK